MRREATMTYRMQMTRRATIIPIATEKRAYINQKVSPGLLTNENGVDDISINVVAALLKTKQVAKIIQLGK